MVWPMMPESSISSTSSQGQSSHLLGQLYGLCLVRSDFGVGFQ